MRRTGMALAGLLTVAVLAGCGDDDDDGVGSGGQPPAAPSPGPAPGSTSGPVLPSPGVPPIADGPVVPAQASEVPAAQVDATALPDGYPKLVWTTEDATSVGMYGQGGGCTQVTAALRGADAGVVRIAIVETTSSGGPCTMELDYPPLAVPLGEPLGERTVVLTREQVGPPPGR